MNQSKKPQNSTAIVVTTSISFVSLLYKQRGCYGICKDKKKVKKWDANTKEGLEEVYSLSSIPNWSQNDVKKSLNVSHAEQHQQ